MGFNEKGEIIRKSGSQRQTKKDKAPRPPAVYAVAGAVGMLLVIGVLQWLSSSPPVPKRAVGEVFRDPLKSGGEGPQMVVLPTGSFRMGSPPGETDRGSDEGPVHTVTISRPIAMGRYEVTFADYDRFVSATNGLRPVDQDQSWLRVMRSIQVNWHEAKAYALWLSKQTGKRYRLPSEAE